MNISQDIYGSDGFFGLPANFTDFRPPSSFAEQLAEVKNRPAELQSFLLSAREEILDARARASEVVLASTEIIYGKASLKFQFKKALAAQLGIPFPQVNLLSPLPAFLASPSPVHVVGTNQGCEPQAAASPARVN